MESETNGKRYKRKKWLKKRAKIDETLQEKITQVEKTLQGSLKYETIRGLNKHQKRDFLQHFDKTEEYKVKVYHDKEEIILRIYPVGNLKRLAEQKTQEVLMKGKPESLPPMGSYERFVIHDYLKDREGIRTESFGEEGVDRHVEIHPLFGRNLKKVKRRLTR